MTASEPSSNPIKFSVMSAFTVFTARKLQLFHAARILNSLSMGPRVIEIENVNMKKHFSLQLLIFNIQVIVCRAVFLSQQLRWFRTKRHSAACMWSRCGRFPRSSCQAACRACSSALWHLQPGVKFTLSMPLFHFHCFHESVELMSRNTVCVPQHRPDERPRGRWESVWAI